MISAPLTVIECHEYSDELTLAQCSALCEITRGMSLDSVLHPRITTLAALKRWLQESVDEDAAFQEAEASADRWHQDYDA